MRPAETPAPETLPLTDELRRWAADTVPGLPLDHERDKFLCYARAHGLTHVDWSEALKFWWLEAHARAVRRGTLQLPAAPRPAPAPEPPPLYDAELHAQMQADIARLCGPAGPSMPGTNDDQGPRRRRVQSILTAEGRRASMTRPIWHRSGRARRSCRPRRCCCGRRSQASTRQEPPIRAMGEANVCIGASMSAWRMSMRPLVAPQRRRRCSGSGGAAVLLAAVSSCRDPQEGLTVMAMFDQRAAGRRPIQRRPHHGLCAGDAPPGGLRRSSPRPSGSSRPCRWRPSLTLRRCPEARACPCAVIPCS